MIAFINLINQEVDGGISLEDSLKMGKNEKKDCLNKNLKRAEDNSAFKSLSLQEKEKITSEKNKERIIDTSEQKVKLLKLKMRETMDKKRAEMSRKQKIKQ